MGILPNVMYYRYWVFYPNKCCTHGLLRSNMQLRQTCHLHLPSMKKPQCEHHRKSLLCVICPWDKFGDWISISPDWRFSIRSSAQYVWIKNPTFLSSSSFLSRVKSSLVMIYFRFIIIKLAISYLLKTRTIAHNIRGKRRSINYVLLLKFFSSFISKNECLIQNPTQWFNLNDEKNDFIDRKNLSNKENA